MLGWWLRIDRNRLTNMIKSICRSRKKIKHVETTPTIYDEEELKKIKGK